MVAGPARPPGGIATNGTVGFNTTGVGSVCVTSFDVARVLLALLASSAATNDAPIIFYGHDGIFVTQRNSICSNHTIA